jgi:hypothetical protein
LVGMRSGATTWEGVLMTSTDIVAFLCRFARRR